MRWLVRPIVAGVLFVISSAFAAGPTTMRVLMPETAGHYKMRFSTEVEGRTVELPLHLYLPRGYEKDKDPRPLVIYLHDQAQRGSDLVAAATVGIERLLRGDGNFRDRFPAIAASPQCPAEGTWDDEKSAQAILRLIAQVRAIFRIDPDRIYITGAGIGGRGAWRVALAAPDQFAAIAVSSAGAVAPERAATSLRHIPAWIASCGGDKEAMGGMAQMVEALNNAGGAAQFAQLGSSREECSLQFHTSGQTYEWILKQKRLGTKERQERDQQLAKQRQEDLAKLPKTPGHHKLQYVTWVGTQKVSLPYLLYLPKGYDRSTATCPTILFMHGAGEADRNLNAMFVHGPGFELNKSEKFRDWYPFINVYPAYENNNPERITASVRLMRDLLGKFRIDADRIYATGLSLGGTASWLVALEAPDLFAGIVPISGREASPDVAGQRLKHLFSWIIAGTNDGHFSEMAKKMAASLSAARAEAQFSFVPGGDHGVWIRYYADQRFYEELLRHRRLTPEQRKAREQTGPPAPRNDAPREPGHHRMAFATQVAGKTVSLPYGLYLPAGYDKSPARWPTVLFLHDPGENVPDLPWTFSYGPAPSLRDNSLQVIGVCPQLPHGRRWDEPELLQALMAMLDDASNKARIDADRLYMCAPGNAGVGAWALMLETPERFAAIATYQATNLQIAPEKLLPKHKYLNAWIGAAGNDNGVTDIAKRLAESLKKVRASVELNLAPSSQSPAFWSPWHTDARFLESFLKLRRLSPQDIAQRQAQEAREELLAVPTTPGIHTKAIEARVDGKPLDVPYAMFIPPAYARSGEKLPLVVYLHDAGSRGTDGASLFHNGPFATLKDNRALVERLRAIVVAPQCAADRAWDQPPMGTAVASLIDQLSAKLRVDPDRVYMTGLGMGGAGAWQMALDDPARFAAIGPVQATNVRLDPADKLRYTAAWISADYNDNAAADMARRMTAALGNTVNEVKLDLPWEFNEEPRWRSFFAQPRLYEWLIAHRRLNENDRRNRDERQQKIAAGGSAVPATPGHHKMKASAYINGNAVDVPYLVYLPQGYEKSDQRWPALVFLHGAGEGQPDLSGIFVHGPAAHIQGDQNLRAWYPMVNISPIHSPSSEGARGAVAAVDDAIKRFRIDPDRVYLTGFSLGGTGVWWTAYEGAGRFAAVSAICGRAVNPDQVAPRLKYTTTWIAVGTGDGDFFVGSQQMRDALRKIGADVHLTLWPNQGHGIWGAYYADRRFYEWFLSHRRLTPEQRALRDKGLYPTSAPSHDGEHRRQIDVQLAGKPAKLTYGVYLPKGYAASGQIRWPLMVHLHDENERGPETAAQFNWGSDVDPRRDPGSRNAFPMIGLSPQCPTDRNWTDPDMVKAVGSLLDELGRTLRVDVDRVYLAGSGQMGQAGVWAMAMGQPGRFAAIAPWYVDGGFKPEFAPRLVGATVSLSAPGKDQGMLGRAQNLVEILRPHRTQVTINPVEIGPAGPVWHPYYTEPKLCAWLLQRRRAAAR